MVTKLIIFIVLISNSEQLFLKQVIMLSRHNVRTPLSNTLSQLSPKPWPKWNEKAGYLTAKGAKLEGYMGKYFAAWLHKEMLLSKCPDDEEFFVYANTAQRTLASAKSFVEHAYPLCNITVHHAKNVDPNFNPVIHNTSSTFLQAVMKGMQHDLKNLRLNRSFDILTQILDYEKSDLCLKDHHCHLSTDENTASVETGWHPMVNGPLKFSNSAIDSFIMEYYEGFKIDNVAWGMLSEGKWRTILEISRSYHNIIFNRTLVAKDISEPLLHYMASLFLPKNRPKVALLMGHDGNIYTVLNAMGFKPYKLKRQHELTPAGGKIVFQRWSDNITDFLKVDYVYQPTEDMRNDVPLTLNNPPLFETMELKDCETTNGLCLWKDFEKLMMKFVSANKCDSTFSVNHL